MFCIAHAASDGSVAITTPSLKRKEDESDMEYVLRCCPFLAGAEIVLADTDQLPARGERAQWWADSNKLLAG